MRTTVTLDDDVARAVDQLRREEGLGVSAAINHLARRGLGKRGEPRARFTQQTSSLGSPLIPLDNIEAVLEVLEGDTRR